MNIESAKLIDGFILNDELWWLALSAQRCQIVIEVGSWHGRSSCAIADNLPPKARLFCIDTWQGSISERETNHASAALLDGDHAFDQFCRNMFDHIATGRVIPLRMHSHHAAKLLMERSVRAELIFIDAGHEQDEVRSDIYDFLPLRAQGGILSGHDYWHGDVPREIHHCPGVIKAVDEIFGNNVKLVPETSIWFTDDLLPAN